MPFGFFEEEDETFSGLSGHVTKRRDMSLERITPSDVEFVSKGAPMGSDYSGKTNSSANSFDAGSYNDTSFTQTKQRRD